MIQDRTTLRDGILYILIPAYWVLYFFAIYYSSGNAKMHFPATLVGTFLFFYLAVKKKLINKIHLRYVWIFLVFGLIAYFRVGNVKWYYFFFVISDIGIALALALSTATLNHLYKNIFYLHVIIYMIYYYVYRTFDSMYNLSSENTVSIYLLLFLYLYYRESEYKLRKVSVIPVAISVVLCVLSTSRTGIAVMLIAFCGILLIKLSNTNGGKVIVFFIIFIGVILVIAVAIFAYSFLIDVLQDAPRMFIWNEYFSNLTSVDTVLLGVPFSKSVYFAGYGYNLHNTFMNIHARFGLIPLFVVVVILFKVAIDSFYKKNWWRLLFIICYVLRSLTDNTSFSGPFDIMFFSIFFDILRENGGDSSFCNDEVSAT